MIIVAGTADVKPERREEAVQVALQMAKATAAEVGCLSYRFYADLEALNTFFLFEEWATAEALAAHFQTAHMQAFQRQLPPLLAGEVVIRRYNVESVTGI